MVIRRFQEKDADTIVSWIQDEKMFRQWSADLFDHYPITGKELCERYANDEKTLTNGFVPMVMEDETGLCGQWFYRFLNPEKTIVRLGFVIVDSAKRGKGYGKMLVQMATDYAYEHYQVEKVTLGVFENNEGAHWCYRAAGFSDISEDAVHFCKIMGEKWKCIEMEHMK